MEILLILIVAIVIVFFALFVLGLCRAAAKQSHHLDEYEQRHKDGGTP